MKHAKRKWYTKFQQNWCEFGPSHTPLHAFYDFDLVGSKNAIFTIHKKIKIVLELCKYARYVGNEEVNKLYQRTHALKSILHYGNIHLL